MSGISTFLSPPLWTSSRLVARLSLREITWTASLDITLPYGHVVSWLCCCRRDGSQTLWPVVSQDPSGWGAAVAILSSSFSSTEATFNGSSHTLGHQFCSFTRGIFCKWCLVLLVYWPPAYLLGLLCPVSSIQVALTPLKNCYQGYAGLGLSLMSSAGKTGTLNPVSTSAVFLSSPSALLHICPQTSWLPAFAI